MWHKYTMVKKFLSTPSARRATLPRASRAAGRGISIHALREEGDHGVSSTSPMKCLFLSTPSARRATQYDRLKAAYDEQFLSTPSARRATYAKLKKITSFLYFYPRPPRGGRPWRRGRKFRSICISIHALREEGDRFCGRCGILIVQNFYPRPPRGGRPIPIMRFH